MSQILITHALRSISPRALPFPCATFPGSTPRVDNTTRDPVAVGDYVPNYIAKRINDFAPTTSKPFVLGLPTGSSPIPTYKALINKVQEGSLSCVYPFMTPGSIINTVDIPPSQVNLLDRNTEDLVTECNAYESRIKQCGGIELFLGGIDEDGHIAFNEPGMSRFFTSCCPFSHGFSTV
ncbi:uncharacterized protein F5147DRAFT_589628 [Suillus discolor]|uniref:Glucosamine-6-phosphate deaminase n=1 Tax=Suillus discolor TaxID=1912936 RepID=A0A9P7EQI2_9AGAM|nr:uncharacterized protein F5147DRAFT_589628 [Suillus discolor]KAG2084117.1 hypothetical protein F5147DRAFT_589628 [Suillus discolor]